MNGRKGVCAEGQWSSRGAVIQAGPSCRQAEAPYALFKRHACRSTNAETLPTLCVH